MPNTNSGYNGWKNYETWNVALYIQNDYRFYTVAKECKSYTEWLHKTRQYGIRGAATADGVPYLSHKISQREINEMIRELAE